MERSSDDNPANELLQAEIGRALAADPDTRPESYSPPAFHFAPEGHAVAAARVIQNERDRIAADITRMDNAMCAGYLRIEAEQEQIDAIALEKDRATEAMASLNRHLADLDTASRRPTDPVRVIESARRPRRASKAEVPHA